MIRTASARRKRESVSPSVTLAMIFSPGSVWRTKSTWFSAVRAMQWPPCATGPTSTSYSSPTSEDVGSFCMRGGSREKGGKRSGPRPDDSPPVYADGVRVLTTTGPAA